MAVLQKIMLVFAALALSTSTVVRGFADGDTCAAVNHTVCNGENAGACRMDCSPDPGATEEECIAKGCCWQETATTDPRLPWCFFPGGSSTCMLGQIAKDNNPAIKSAAQAYHVSGSQHTVEAYRAACMLNGNRFFSFFVTPQIWVETQDNTTQSHWHSTEVTLIKYGCNAAACDDNDIENVMHKMQVAQQPQEYAQGYHSSFRYNVTACAFESARIQGGVPLTKCAVVKPAPAPATPAPTTPAPTNAPIVPTVNCPDGSGDIAWWVVVLLVSALVVLAAVVGCLYNKYRTMSPGSGYQSGAPLDLSKTAMPVAAVTAGPSESPRTSLVNSQF